MKILLCIGHLLYLFLLFRHNVHMYQLNSYFNSRYQQYVLKNYKSLIPDLVVLALIMINSLFFSSSNVYLVGVIAFMLCLLIAEMGVKKPKKPLVLTNRVYRLILTVCLLLAPVLIYALLTNENYWFLVPLQVVATVSPFLLMVAGVIVAPVEKANQKKYITRARHKLQAHPELTVIAITGSYGKTSTKHFLNKVLSAKYNVLITPKSYNTPMGIVRTINDSLKRHHEIFVVEMGAKKRGDIAEICDIISPDISIVTAIGEQHLDTFLTLDTIIKEKLSLVSFTNAKGFSVVNTSNPKVGSAELAAVAGHVKEVVYYGSIADRTPKSDLLLSRITYGDKNSTFEVVAKDGVRTKFSTNIVGKYLIENLLSVILVARHLGIEDNYIGYAIMHLENTRHRLSIVKKDNGITIIDDAFNSNPKGAEMALEVLQQTSGDRKIVVTPGFVEQGDKFYEANYEFAKSVAAFCDIVIVVSENAKAPLLDGLAHAGKKEGDVFFATTFKEASKLLDSIQRTGDVILYENDLPDNYEKQ